jgi:ABC-type branched-subunit amino acid transport system substrate-binding protein
LPSVPVFGDAVPDARAKEVYTTFFDAFKPTKVRPDLLDTVAWDPAMLVADGLRAVGTDADAAQIKSYLEGLHGWVGVSGTYDFRAGDQRGLGADTMVIVRWDPAKDTWTAVSRLGGYVRR